MSDLIVRPRMLKSGKMVYEYAFEIARIDGKRKRKTKSGFRTKREAKEAGKIELSLYEKCGQTTKDTNISVADFFDLWMEKDCGLTCKESTLDGYHKKIRLYIKPSIGEYYLKNITKDILQDFIKDMYDKGFSKNTISSIRGIVTKAFRWAEEKHYIVASPATNLIIPRNQQPQKATITRQKPHIYVSEDRIKQIFERFPEKEPAHLPLMIIYHCGLRVGEVFGLTWEDIDFENKLLRVNRQVQWHQGKRTKKDIKLYNGTSKSNGYWYFSEPKYNSYRQIDLDDELIALLKREKEWQLKSEEYYAEYYTRYYCDQKLYVLGEKPTYDIIPMNPIKTTKTDNEINFVCKLVSYELKKQSSIYIVRCTLHDIYTQNELCVSWFGTTEMYNVLKKDYHPGDTCFIGGKLKASNKKNLFFMSNPIIFKKYDGESDCHIYTAYEKIRGISESNFERIINDCLEHATIPDKVPRELLHKYNLMSKDEAIREMHKPSSVEGVKKAKYRLNIDDLLYFALQLEEKKRNLPAGSVYGIHSLAITTKIIKNLPFQLTKDQKSAYEELVNRIRSGKRLNALIQGDVGCGKTILAFLLMFVMADNGFQSVLLAPTQVLASQHYNELKEMAAQYNIDVVYIANGLKKKEREAILKSIEDGSALMIVGTHSVLSKEVKFHDLGLSITDEEHRFGVLQREEITTKAKAGMHTVTMSATPIPRSLSDVLLSTTEVFNIQSMPNGRKPIQTAICASQNTIFQFIKKEIEKGHQAYVVCPLIEDKQGVMEGILSVEQTYTEYANIFGKNAVAVLNGKMNEDETEKVIRSFKNGEIKILVSTTVVEVGVNVSNATVIVINNAERFGLASLHQLRGRVGRGNSQGYCILNSVHKNNKRLLALCKYKNGFQIAESDYALRGSGNILGTEQSGSNYYVELSMKYPDLFSELQKYAKKYMDTGEAEMIVKTYQMSIKR